MTKTSMDIAILCIGILGYGCVASGLGGFLGWPGALVGVGAMLIFVYQRISQGMKEKRHEHDD